MKHKSDGYWVKRADERMDRAQLKATKAQSVISLAYDNALKAINEDIENIITNFSKQEGMSRSEAIKLLNEKISNKQLARIRKKIATVTDKEERTKLMNKLNAQAYRARITNRQALKYSIQAEMQKLAGIELHTSNNLYVSVLKEGYYRSIYDIQKGTGIAFDFGKLAPERISQIIRHDWSGKHFSTRIWGNTKNYGQIIEDTLVKKLMTGKNSRVIAKELADKTNTSKFVAERLLRTETTYFSTMADLEAYDDVGVDQIKFVATLDSRTSEACQEHDGKIIDRKDAEPGKNVPPLHPFCRSTTIAVLDGLEHKVRIARDSNGKNITVPASMTYPEWYAKYGE